MTTRDELDHPTFTQDDEVDTEETPDCPACGGAGVPLGALGNTEHFRCRACGVDFSRRPLDTSRTHV